MGDIQIPWTFMRINHEQFKQDILEHEQVLKTMIEKGYTCVKPYATEEDKVKE
jgi:spore coat protein CotF